MADLFRQQWKRDTAGNFTSDNPILLVGEPAIETDANKWKIGDGSTAWNDLPYMGITQNTPANIASTNVIYTFPTAPHHNQEVGLSWYDGDGSNQFIIDNSDVEAVLYGNSEFDLTSKQRWGEGSGECVFWYDANSSAWRVKSYSDSGRGLFTDEFDKYISGKVEITNTRDINGIVINNANGSNFVSGELTFNTVLTLTSLRSIGFKISGLVASWVGSGSGVDTLVTIFYRIMTSISVTAGVGDTLYISLNGKWASFV